MQLLEVYIPIGWELYRMNLCPGYFVHLIVIAMTYLAARPRDECFAAID